jgi:hypothetical protein
MSSATCRSTGPERFAEVCVFDNATAYPGRGHDSQIFVGLQVYPDPRALMAYRRIQLKSLP